MNKHYIARLRKMKTCQLERELHHRLKVWACEKQMTLTELLHLIVKEALEAKQ